jgi:hypothetical protein
MDSHGYIVASRSQIVKYLTGNGQNLTYDADTASGVSSLEDFGVLGQQYIPPIDGSDPANAMKEIDVKVVSKCLNKYCNYCDDYDLTSCNRCWGRFGDQDKN